MIRLIILIAIAIAGYLIYKLYFQQLMKQGTSGKIKIAMIVVGLSFLALAAMGRAHIAFGIIGALMTQVMRFIPLLSRFAPFLQKYLPPLSMSGKGAHSNNGTGAESRVATASLVMTLNHATGQINGEVIAGQFENRLLSELSNAELYQFYQYCESNDVDAIRLLDAYIARERSDWHEAPESDNGEDNLAKGDGVSVREAYDILGLQPDADKEQIISAHRSLMSQLHPDRGGSNYLAAKVNEAKKILLSRLS